MYYFGLYVIIIGFLGVGRWPFNDSKLIYKICESISSVSEGTLKKLTKVGFFGFCIGLL